MGMYIYYLYIYFNVQVAFDFRLFRQLEFNYSENNKFELILGKNITYLYNIIVNLLYLIYYKSLIPSYRRTVVKSLTIN